MEYARVMDAHPLLEALAAAPDDPAPWAVYADFLKPSTRKMLEERGVTGGVTKLDEAGLVNTRQGLGDKLSSETTPVDERDRWWTWKCPTAGCKGFLHAAGYARDLHAVYVVCDGTCAKTFLR